MIGINVITDKHIEHGEELVREFGTLISVSFT
jgi:hypothetical protein